MTRGCETKFFKPRKCRREIAAEQRQGIACGASRGTSALAGFDLRRLTGASTQILNRLRSTLFGAGSRGKTQPERREYRERKVQARRRSEIARGFRIEQA